MEEFVSQFVEILLNYQKFFIYNFLNYNKMHSIPGPQFRSSQLLKCAYRSLKWFIINIKFIAQFAKVSLSAWAAPANPIHPCPAAAPRLPVESPWISSKYDIKHDEDFFKVIFSRSGSDESASRQVTPQQHSEPSRVNTGSPLTWVEITTDSSKHFSLASLIWSVLWCFTLSNKFSLWDCEKILTKIFHKI